MQLSDRHLRCLVEVMARNPKIVDLDISWNRFTTVGLLKFMGELEEANRLKSLNVSWNSLKSPIEPGTQA